LPATAEPRDLASQAKRRDIRGLDFRRTRIDNILKEPALAQTPHELLMEDDRSLFGEPAVALVLDLPAADRELLDDDHLVLEAGRVAASHLEQQRH
jgi:hypothetical protein